MQKNQEPFSNTAAHLQCYEAKGPAINRPVAVQNQFGSQLLLVTQPDTLCVPSQKRKLKRSGKPKGQFPAITVPIDHYQCYSVQPQSQLFRLGALQPVTLSDQFGQETVQVGPPVQLCTPTQKNQELSQHPVKHLVCYQISDKKRRSASRSRTSSSARSSRSRSRSSSACPRTRSRCRRSYSDAVDVATAR